MDDDIRVNNKRIKTTKQIFCKHTQEKKHPRQNKLQQKNNIELKLNNREHI